MSTPVANEAASLTISKLDAARRQLQAAIALWFNGGDPVAVHTLACAAYEIIHAVSLKRNPGRRDLLFDSLVVKDEHRRDFNTLVKNPANFFKHADRDPDSVIEFKPILTELFFMYSIMGVKFCGECHNLGETAFMTWLHVHKPQFLTDKGRKFVADTLPSHELRELQSLRKDEFFQVIELAWSHSQQLPAAERRSIPRRKHFIRISD
jgi:hypothetical protein